MSAQRSYVAGLALALAAASGCSSAPVLQQHSFDFKTTALFKLPCDSLVVQAMTQGEKDPLETPENACNAARMLRMVANFMTITETDALSGIPGDTVEQVRAKGFTIYLPDGQKRRANTRQLYGNEALAAVGMGVAPPPLQKPEEIRAYTDFMGQLYGEEYTEKDLRSVTDRICLNRRASRDTGDDRTFAILWRDGHVIKRVIKGGPINEAKQERALLLCPGSLITDTISGAGKKMAIGVVP